MLTWFDVLDVEVCNCSAGCNCTLTYLPCFRMQRMPASLQVRAQAARPFVSKVEGKMGYEDFVWFILSEEDKTNDVSLEYWFRRAPRCAASKLLLV